MNLPEPDAERLDDYRFQMGHDAGNLALVLDNLTDVLRLLGQHKVYCRVEKGLRAGEPPLDIVELTRLLEATKDLVKDSLLRLKSQ
ncbi:hypothetical protein [Fimbriiglobus ruber]|uniref:hypothetical protein n=1 Tax=Fimbriiglobus ruber TaxID=1908690 RepID=UPI000B4B6104|nr:hypothetical protein [Fimbriiglobus ruber]